MKPKTYIERWEEIMKMGKKIDLGKYQLELLERFPFLRADAVFWVEALENQFPEDYKVYLVALEGEPYCSFVILMIVSKRLYKTDDFYMPDVNDAKFEIILDYKIRDLVPKIKALHRVIGEDE